MSGNLYQLKTLAPVGACVTFAGVHDKFGVVLKQQDSGYHLIRGLGMTPPQGVNIHYSAEVSK